MNSILGSLEEVRFGSMHKDDTKILDMLKEKEEKEKKAAKQYGKCCRRKTKKEALDIVNFDSKWEDNYQTTMVMESVSKYEFFIINLRHSLAGENK